MEETGFLVPRATEGHTERRQYAEAIRQSRTCTGEIDWWQNSLLLKRLTSVLNQKNYN